MQPLPQLTRVIPRGHEGQRRWRRFFSTGSCTMIPRLSTTNASHGRPRPLAPWRHRARSHQRHYTVWHTDAMHTAAAVSYSSLPPPRWSSASKRRKRATPSTSSGPRGAGMGDACPAIACHPSRDFGYVGPARCHYIDSRRARGERVGWSRTVRNDQVCNGSPYTSVCTTWSVDSRTVPR